MVAMTRFRIRVSIVSYFMFTLSVPYSIRRIWIIFLFIFIYLLGMEIDKDFLFVI